MTVSFYFIFSLTFIFCLFLVEEYQRFLKSDIASYQILLNHGDIFSSSLYTVLSWLPLTTHVYFRYFITLSCLYELIHSIFYSPPASVVKYSIFLPQRSWIICPLCVALAVVYSFPLLPGLHLGPWILTYALIWNCYGRKICFLEFSSLRFMVCLFFFLSFFVFLYQ